MVNKRFTFDKDAFLANYALLSAQTKGSCGSVVKRNAYGTGATRAVRLLDKAGCRHFFVATPAEGVEIREVTSSNIYILSGPTDDDEARLITHYQLIPVLNSRRQLTLWKSYRKHQCAVHVDTGMQRLGFEQQMLETLDFSQLNVCLVLTHLACADQPLHPLNSKQLADFKQVSRMFPNTATSIGNSAGVFLGEEFQGEVARPGIGLYGGNPFAVRDSPVTSVCTLEGRILQIRTLEPNTSVGYGASYTTDSLSRVGVVGIGYADGLSCALSNNGWVAFQEQLLPIIGKVSMDAIHIDCTKAPSLQEGDYVEFFGPTISIDEMATQTNTTAYEILVQVGNSMFHD